MSVDTLGRRTTALRSMGAVVITLGIIALVFALPSSDGTPFISLIALLLYVIAYGTGMVRAALLPVREKTAPTCHTFRSP